MFENYLLKDVKNHTADLGPVLVDTCFNKRLHLAKKWRAETGPGKALARKLFDFFLARIAMARNWNDFNLGRIATANANKSQLQN